jgi:nucleoside permease NupC
MISMQFSIAGLTLKLPAGAAAIEKFGEAVKEFLSFAEEGAEFVYGPNYQDHYFAMVVLSIIIFFGGFLGVCYHLGIIQVSPPPK